MWRRTLLRRHSTRREVEIRSHGISGNGQLRVDADSDGTLSRSISHAGFVAHRGQDPKKIYKFQLDLCVVEYSWVRTDRYSKNY
jgi:hypothetical protein